MFGISLYRALCLQWDEVTALVAKWSAGNTDPKANILPSYSVLGGVQFLYMLMFYNGPTPPNGLFDDFLAIPALVNDIKTRDFAGFVGSTAGNSTTGMRCVNNVKRALRQH